MYHDTIYEVRKDGDLFSFCDDITSKAKCMYNTTNYYIRNVMTGIRKEEKDRTPNEKEVLETVCGMIPKINDIIKTPKHKKRSKKKKGSKEIKLPTEDKWMLSYNTLDGIFKLSDDPDYRSLPANIAQNAIKECVNEWKGYFSSLKPYKKDPTLFLGLPKIPKYKKGDHATAVIGNQLSYVKDGMLHLPGRHTLDISGYVPDGKFIETRISPYYNGYVIHVITEDGITSKRSKAKGIMMIDPGVNNFVSVCDNRGGVPFIVKGGFIKSRNQWFNKKKAELTSILMKGRDPKKYRPPETRRLNALSEKRDRFLRDCFYKISHRIAREAIRRKCGTVVIGKNELEKQNVNIGHMNDQTFVMLPIARFIGILTTVCSKYGIEVVPQEESYTSKASALDKDDIPTYHRGDDTAYTFSGKRVKRGLYVSKNGIELNADINGSMNIGRKYDPNVLSKVRSYDNITKKIEVLEFESFYKKESSPGKAG